MKSIPILEWSAGLAALPEEGFCEAVNGYVKEWAIDIDSVAPYTYFDPTRYTRNLVFKNDLFEVLLLCWEAGTQAPIHNHRDQECWMIMVDGCLEIVNYRAVEQDAERSYCKLEPSSTVRLTRDNPVGIDQDEPIHAVINCPHVNEQAMSVHVYSRPFDTCEVYDFQAQTYKVIQLTNHSEHGKLVSR